MSIRPVKELPARAGFGEKRPSFVAADMREFIRKGMDVALIEQIVAACKKYVEAHPEQYRGVKAGVRGGRAYVWREDQR